MSPSLTGIPIRQNDLAQILEHEVSRLPDRYRIVISLCLVEGLTHREAAGQLGWAMGTVESRLARGRELLRKRLSRRGLAPAFGLRGAGMCIEPASALSRALVRATVQTVSRSALRGALTTGSISEVAKLGAQRHARLQAGSDTRAGDHRRVLLRSRRLPGEPGIRASAGCRAGARPSRPIRRRLRTAPLMRSRPKLVAPSGVRATAGRGSFLVYVLDENDRRNPTYEEKPEAHRWVVVTGLLDHLSIRKSLAVSLALAKKGGAASLGAHPDYRRVDVERQECRPGGAWSAWAEVDREANCVILSNVPEVEGEQTPEQFRLPALVDHLPFLKTGDWAGASVEGLVKAEEKKPAVQGPARRTVRPLFPTTEAPEIMVRSLDFTVQPGFSYRYKLRIVIDASDGVGQRREVVGHWSEPSAVVTASD